LESNYEHQIQLHYLLHLCCTCQKKGLPDFSESPILTVLRELDSNQRPSGYEPDELPTAPSRDIS
jgi:hypothetical protein